MDAPCNAQWRLRGPAGNRTLVRRVPSRSSFTCVADLPSQQGLAVSPACPAPKVSLGHRRCQPPRAQSVWYWRLRGTRTPTRPALRPPSRPEGCCCRWQLQIARLIKAGRALPTRESFLSSTSKPIEPGGEKGPTGGKPGRRLHHASEEAVRTEGIEPSQPLVGHRHLKPARLPKFRHVRECWSAGFAFRGPASLTRLSPDCCPRPAVHREGIEPSHPEGYGHLKPARLPSSATCACSFR